MNLRDLILNNVRLKLLSLIFAASLWFFVTMEGTDEMELPLAIAFANIPAGTAMREAALPKLSVTVSGARILLLRQQFKGVSACVDLSGAAVGRIALAGMERYVRLDGGLRPLRVSPGTLTITLENARSTGMK